MDKANPIGILLLTFGGPDCPNAIEPFMTSIMGGRKPPAALLDKMVARYKLIGGGKSPLPEVTAQQATLLEQLLREQGVICKAYVGMLHCPPFIQDALSAMLADGIEHAVAVSLSPHFAQVTTGAYAQAIERAMHTLDAQITVNFAPGCYDYPYFIEALAEKLLTGLEQFPPAVRSEVDIIFTAHSLPVAHITDGDPYVDQLRTTATALVEALGLTHWHIAFQSKGGGQGEWLGPSVEEVMDNLAAAKRCNVLVSPIGFATDHIETLYDIDVAQRQHAATLGLNFHRAAALNTSPKFIAVLAEVVRAASK
ncbi:MAG: ferrochelatase [Peptococcaceae bacterium]|nr:ferrochelatase [Peptococcaceae bacterium]